MAIVIKDLKKSFGEMATPVLKGINATIETGEFVSITGRSGSGKSTLLYIISTLDPPSSGEVEIDGQKLSSLTTAEVHRFRNLKMGFVFQFHHLLPELTAVENVLMPAIKTKVSSQRKSQALELLGEFGIRDKADRLPGQLSGGEQQRVAIARALIMEPSYLFADEPTGNLDSTNAQSVMNLFSRINRERKTTVIFVTHDQEFAKMAPRRIDLVDGQLSS
jgi:putative ABC transport system ATP-binding protein/lipoprotein-releasing system ATP-binding protein